MLTGAATTGIGLINAVIAAGSLLIEDEPGMLNAHSVALAAVGGAGIILGQAILRGSHNFGNGIIGLGAALALQGLLAMAGGSWMPGSALAVGGIATATFGLGWTRRRYSLYGLGLIGIGAASLAIGVALLHNRHIVYGLVFLGHGAAVVASGFALQLGNVDVYEITQVCAGLTNAALGIAVLVGGGPLIGIALLGVSTAAIAANLNGLRHGDLSRRASLWWKTFITEPSQDVT
ncbi:hypothetical protein [Actinoplanes sp. GCM10030250]|uniref:hypothetical protein n=1 Tax=Actinoplanes sp. GCM10030250 TaxID=3273376 RepID=UPI003607A7E2